MSLVQKHVLLKDSRFHDQAETDAKLVLLKCRKVQFPQDWFLIPVPFNDVF